TGAPLNLQLVPVGLAYECKTAFRSRVLLVVGRPLTIDPAPEEERGEADALTERIRVALNEVVLQAESRDLLEDVARLAAWTGEGDEDEVERNRRARQLLAAYHALNEQAPERVEPVVRAARTYGRVLRRLGVK